MEIKNKKHTVIIPSHNTLSHLKNTYESIKRYASDVSIIIIDDASNDGTAEWLEKLKDDYLKIIISDQRKGHTYWYDEGIKQSNTDIVSILHSDMIIGPGYFSNLLKHVKKGKVICATRIEPPIHPAGKEKIVKDFGDESYNFKWDEFEKFVIQEKADNINHTTKGIFAPWMLYKEDHLSIGGHDQRFAPYGYEDSDIFNRWIQAGYEMVQARDSLCYHMTCRGHRWNAGVGIENADYGETMERCRKEFLRKWGEWIQNDEYQYPIINPKYDKGIIIKNCTKTLLSYLEPWADTIYVDCDYTDYIAEEQKNTITNLHHRIKPFNSKKHNEILINIDANNFTQHDFNYITQLSAIIKDSGSVGNFKLGNITIDIIKLVEHLVS